MPNYWTDATPNYRKNGPITMTTVNGCIIHGILLTCLRTTSFDFLA